jgi:hypothetical protein
VNTVDVNNPKVDINGRNEEELFYSAVPNVNGTFD